jgi:hypothetical protein
MGRDAAVWLSFRDDEPQHNVGQDARQATWQQQEQKEQAKPQGIDAKEDTQPTTDPGENPILAAQFIVGHANSF